MQYRETYTRVAYCPRCAERGSPKQGDEAIVYGNTTGNYHVVKAKHGFKGFSPHLVSLLRITDTVRVVRLRCAILGCGMEAVFQGEEQTYYKTLKYSDYEMTPEQHKAFMHFVDEYYFVD